MITNYVKVRQLMAENGYEHTPTEAKEIVDDFNRAIEKLTQPETLAYFRDMTQNDMKVEAKRAKMSVKSFKELILFILEIGEWN